MRSITLLLAVAMTAACAPAKEEAAPPAPPAGPTLADFAGTWNTTTTLTGVADPVASVMTGGADGSGWTMTLEGRPPIPVQVSVVGDSLISQSAEYESVLRAGVMVSVRTASVLSDGMLMGNMVATYKTAGGTEVVTGTMHATRAPQ